jgi:hypothetical protein
MVTTKIPNCGKRGRVNFEELKTDQNTVIANLSERPSFLEQEMCSPTWDDTCTFSSSPEKIQNNKELLGM